MRKVFIYTLTANSSEDPATNNILMFSDVEDVIEHDDELYIFYTGQSTGTKNKAVFTMENIAGYAITDIGDNTND